MIIIVTVTVTLRDHNRDRDRDCDSDGGRDRDSACLHASFGVYDTVLPNETLIASVIVTIHA